MNGIDLYDGITLHQGDCRDIMRNLPADHFDAVITDPPYGISFLGEKWDTATPHGFQAWAQSWGGGGAARTQARRLPARVQRAPHLPPAHERPRGRRLRDPRRHGLDPR